MTVPTTVQRQLAEAEALQQALNAPAPAPTEAPAPAPTPTEPAPAPAPAANQDPNALEHRIRTLQGMLNSESARAKTRDAENQALRVQLDKLSKQVEQLSAAPKAAPAPATIDPKDIEAFGSDMVAMVQRYAAQTFEQMKTEFSGAVAQLSERLTALEGGVQSLDQKNEARTEQLFYVNLAKAVPDWETLNTDPEFLAWLSEVDPIFGVPRQAGLLQAHREADADRAARVFLKFKESRPKPPTPDALAAPRGVASPPPAAPGPVPKKITTAYINEFYLNDARGRYRNNPQLREQLEAEINAAIAAGNVT